MQLFIMGSDSMDDQPVPGLKMPQYLPYGDLNIIFIPQVNINIGIIGGITISAGCYHNQHDRHPYGETQNFKQNDHKKTSS